MTTFTNDAEGLSALLREFMSRVRRYAAQEGPDDQVERILAAIATAMAALILAWPKGRAVPRFVQLLAAFARSAWQRRSWWLPE